MAHISHRALFASGSHLRPLHRNTKIAAAAHPPTLLPASIAGCCGRHLSSEQSNSVLLSIEPHTASQLRSVKPPSLSRTRALSTSSRGLLAARHMTTNSNHPLGERLRVHAQSHTSPSFTVIRSICHIGIDIPPAVPLLLEVCNLLANN